LLKKNLYGQKAGRVWNEYFGTMDLAARFQQSEVDLVYNASVEAWRSSCTVDDGIFVVPIRRLPTTQLSIWRP
jgi:hypothetical protein